MELLTQNPYGSQPHQVVARSCGIDHCRATTPCFRHGAQVIVRFCIDGIDYPEIKLSKQGFQELEYFHRKGGVPELFHMLADLAVDADKAPQLLNTQPSMASMMNGLNAGPSVTRSRGQRI